MTAKEALKHEWLNTEKDVNLLPNVRKNFNAKRTFKKAVLAAMAMKMRSPKSGSPMLPNSPTVQPEITQESIPADAEADLPDAAALPKIPSKEKLESTLESELRTSVPLSAQVDAKPLSEQVVDPS